MRETHDAYLAITSGASQGAGLESAGAQSKLIGYESGVCSGVGVLNAQREVFRTRLDLSQVRYVWLQNRLRQKAAVGTLNDADLGEINAWLPRGAGDTEATARRPPAPALNSPPGRCGDRRRNGLATSPDLQSRAETPNFWCAGTG